MLEFTQCGATGAQRIRIRPNCAISGRALALVFLALAAGSLLFSLALALQGYWVPLPFAGAELLALGLALAWVRRDLARSEEIAIGPRAIEVRQAGRSTDFSPAWMRVELRDGRYRHHPRRLLLRCHGRETEIGQFLEEREREQLAARLAELLRPYSAWAL